MWVKVSRIQDVFQTHSIHQPVFSKYVRLNFLTPWALLSLYIKVQDFFPEQANGVYRTNLWWWAPRLMDLLMWTLEKRPGAILRVSLGSCRSTPAVQIPVLPRQREDKRHCPKVKYSPCFSFRAWGVVLCLLCPLSPLCPEGPWLTSSWLHSFLTSTLP